jgi:hypothetical protein
MAVNHSACHLQRKSPRTPLTGSAEAVHHVPVKEVVIYVPASIGIPSSVN